MSARIFPLLALLFTTATVVGCGDDGGATSDAGTGDAGVGPIEMVLSLEPDFAFFEQPFPLESRRTAGGAPDVSGWPNPRRLPLIGRYQALAEDRDGFSPSGPVWIAFTGPLDGSALPTVEESSAPESPVFLVNVDPGSPERGGRTPVRVTQTAEDDTYRPAGLLQVLPEPGFALREHTTYAVIVMAAVGSGDATRPLVQSPTLASLLAGGTPDGGEAVVSAYAPLRAYLADEGIAPEEVVAATVFRTGDVTSQLVRWVEWAGALPAREPTSEPSRIYDLGDYCAYEATWAAPQFQEGTPPFEEEGGRFVLDGDGLPVEQGTQTASFVVSVPKRAMPADGFPLVFYVNGTGGLARQILDRGTVVGATAPAPGTGPAMRFARRGWAASGVAGPLNPERIGAAASMDGFVMYNFLNPVAMRDNFMQAVLEHVLFRRLVTELRIDPAGCDGVDASAAADGMVRFDPGHVVVMGQSLGSYLSGMLAATDTGFEGAILTGAGGSWIEFAFGPTSPVDLRVAVEALIGLPSREMLDPFHPVIAMFDLAVGPADNLHYVDQVHREPLPGHDPVPVLVIEGFEDDNIPENLQRGLVVALGVDLVGDDVGTAGILEAIRLAGGEQLAAPVSDNRDVTAGVVRYLPDFPMGGHYVTFQLEPPMHQYGCFVQTLYESGTPVIVEGTAADAPCE